MNYNSYKRNEVILVTYQAKEDLDVLKIFGNNVRIARNNKKLTICQLAKNIKCDREGISLIENGERNPNFVTAIKIAKALDIAFPDLLSRNFSLVLDDNIGSKYTEEAFLLIFAENINKRLNNLEMNQRQLSIDTGISESNICKILKGKNKNPRLTTLDLLSKAIQTDLTQLFTR